MLKLLIARKYMFLTKNILLLVVTMKFYIKDT